MQGAVIQPKQNIESSEQIDSQGHPSLEPAPSAKTLKYSPKTSQYFLETVAHLDALVNQYYTKGVRAAVTETRFQNGGRTKKSKGVKDSVIGGYLAGHERGWGHPTPVVSGPKVGGVLAQQVQGPVEPSPMLVEDVTGSLVNKLEQIASRQDEGFRRKLSTSGAKQGGTGDAAGGKPRPRVYAADGSTGGTHIIESGSAQTSPAISPEPGASQQHDAKISSNTPRRPESPLLQIPEEPSYPDLHHPALERAVVTSYAASLFEATSEEEIMPTAKKVFAGWEGTVEDMIAEAQGRQLPLRGCIPSKSVCSDSDVSPRKEKRVRFVEEDAVNEGVASVRTEAVAASGMLDMRACEGLGLDDRQLKSILGHVPRGDNRLLAVKKLNTTRKGWWIGEVPKDGENTSVEARKAGRGFVIFSMRV